MLGRKEIMYEKDIECILKRNIYIYFYIYIIYIFIMNTVLYKY